MFSGTKFVVACHTEIGSLLFVPQREMYLNFLQENKITNCEIIKWGLRIFKLNAQLNILIVHSNYRNKSLLKTHITKKQTEKHIMKMW